MENSLVKYQKRNCFTSLITLSAVDNTIICWSFATRLSAQQAFYIIISLLYCFEDE